MSEEKILKVLKDRPYFFDGGLCFECQRCGECCTGEPGIIYVTPGEIGPIAQFLDISEDVFVERCLYPFQDSYSIREAEDGRCIFYENGCAIYPVRPMQCRSYPFWFQNLRSENMWRAVKKQCPGIGKGRRYSKEEILYFVGSSFHIFLKALQESSGE